MFDEESMRHLERLRQESGLTGMAAHISTQIIGPAPALEEIKIRAVITHVCSELVARAAAFGLSPAAIEELMSLEGVLKTAQHHPEHPDPSGPAGAEDGQKDERQADPDMDPALTQALEELSRDMEKMMDPDPEGAQAPEPQRIETADGVGFLNHVAADSELGPDPMRLFHTVRRTLEVAEADGRPETGQAEDD